MAIAMGQILLGAGFSGGDSPLGALREFIQQQADWAHRGEPSNHGAPAAGRNAQMAWDEFSNGMKPAAKTAMNTYLFLAGFAAGRAASGVVLPDALKNELDNAGEYDASEPRLHARLQAVHARLFGARGAATEAKPAVRRRSNWISDWSAAITSLHGGAVANEDHPDAVVPGEGASQ